MRSIVALSVFLIAVVLCSTADARKWRVRPHDLAAEYSQVIDQRGGGEVVVVYWIAPETIDPGMQQAEVLKTMLKEHVIVALTHGTAGQGGRLDFRAPEGVMVEAANKKQRESLAKESWPPLVSAYTLVMQNFLSQTTGQLGSGFHWFVFEGKGIESCGKGRFWITYAGERYNYDTPIPGCSQ
jgi:hypothetical protein